MSDGGKQSGAQNAQISLRKLVLDLDEVQRHGEGPHRICADLPTAWLDEVLRDTDGRSGDPGAVELQVSLQGDGTVLLRGELQLAYSVPCARCLSPAEVAAGGPLCITAVPAARLRSELESAMRGATDAEGLEIEAQQLDQVGYEGRTIDVGHLLGEQALLAYPIRALCARAEACLGLCSSCGAALNDDPDGEHTCTKAGNGSGRAEGATESPDTAWKAALRKLTQS